MSALTSLNIAENQLSGSLPGTLKFLTNLQRLELDQNSFDGTIPDELVFLTNLETLTLSNNQLSGSIPKEALQLKALRVVDLSYNQLSGSLPSVLGENLERFTAFSNSLTGTFPWTTPSPKLIWVRFSENSLTGTLPWADIAKFPSLTRIEMSGNELKGGLNDAMGQLSTLNMNLQSNELTGTIPTAIGNLTDIRQLQLGGNQLSGRLPSELGNLGNLQELTLEDNYSLSGTIPTELAELSELGEFYMFYMMAGYGAVEPLSKLNDFLCLNQNAPLLTPTVSQVAYRQNWLI
jgi:Leucine-rich repeat (LRR) protein